MKAPICRVCGIAHWGGEHVWPQSAKPRAATYREAVRQDRALVANQSVAPEEPVDPRAEAFADMAVRNTGGGVLSAEEVEADKNRVVRVMRVPSKKRRGDIEQVVVEQVPSDMAHPAVLASPAAPEPALPSAGKAEPALAPPETAKTPPHKRSIAGKRAEAPISAPDPEPPAEPIEPAPENETPEEKKRRYFREKMRLHRANKAREKVQES